MARKLPPLSRPVAHAVAELIHAGSPISHDQLGRLVRSAGLAAADPGSAQGKVKRMRAVMEYAMANDRAAGARLADRTLQAIRAAGGFREDDPSFIGTDAYLRVRDAYRSSEFDLDPDGELRPRLLEHVPQMERHEVLLGYVRRVQRGATDAPLVTGTGKDLLEATARHVLEQNGRSYVGHDFPGTLFHAFVAVGLTTPPTAVIHSVNKGLSKDGREALSQVLFLLGCTVNRLRNQEGTGHGRPFKASVTDKEAKVAVEAMALVSEMLLSAGAV